MSTKRRIIVEDERAALEVLRLNRVEVVYRTIRCDIVLEKILDINEESDEETKKIIVIDTVNPIPCIGSMMIYDDSILPIIEFIKCSRLFISLSMILRMPYYELKRQKKFCVIRYSETGNVEEIFLLKGRVENLIH